MERMHLIEIHEQPWCPRVIRNSTTDCLRIVAGVGQQYKYLLPKLRQALQVTGSRQVIDLCSGGGGPWFSLAGQINGPSDRPVDVVLTDLYPNESVIDGGEQHSPHLRFERRPIDATQVPPSLQGFRTLFTAFHHFKPETAQAILQNAVSQGQGIGIFEQTRRHPLALLVMLVIPLIAWLVMPFIRPFRWSRMFWTYVLPAIPLVLCFDGIVSCLRTYSPAEIRELVNKLDGPDYVWDIGSAPSPLSPIGVTYAIGYPAKFSGLSSGPAAIKSTKRVSNAP